MRNKSTEATQKYSQPSIERNFKNQSTDISEDRYQPFCFMDESQTTNRCDTSKLKKRNNIYFQGQNESEECDNTYLDTSNLTNLKLIRENTDSKLNFDHTCKNDLSDDISVSIEYERNRRYRTGNLFNNIHINKSNVKKDIFNNKKEPNQTNMTKQRPKNTRVQDNASTKSSRITKKSIDTKNLCQRSIPKKSHSKITEKNKNVVQPKSKPQAKTFYQNHTSVDNELQNKNVRNLHKHYPQTIKNENNFNILPTSYDNSKVAYSNTANSQEKDYHLGYKNIEINSLDSNDIFDKSFSNIGEITSSRGMNFYNNNYVGNKNSIEQQNRQTSYVNNENTSVERNTKPSKKKANSQSPFVRAKTKLNNLKEKNSAKKHKNTINSKIFTSYSSKPEPKYTKEND